MHAEAGLHLHVQMRKVRGFFSLSGEVDRSCPIWRPVSRVWGRVISPGERSRYHLAISRLVFTRSWRLHHRHGQSSRPHADSCPSVRPEAFWLLGTRLLAGSFLSTSHTVPSPLPLVAVSIARVRVFPWYLMSGWDCSRWWAPPCPLPLLQPTPVPSSSDRLFVSAG